MPSILFDTLSVEASLQRFLSTPLRLKLKYLIELIFSAIALFLLSPLMIILAVSIKLTSKGPVFYRTTRIGYRGQTFELMKFRSMKHNCPQIVDNFKTVVEKRDPRLTPIGSFLRIGFDELPQLFNVMKGDITLIGPRPSLPSARRLFNDVLSQKLELLPGISGLAVVCDGRNLSIHDNFALDVWYAQHHTFKLDFKIAITTPLYMLGFKKINQELYKRIIEDWNKTYPVPAFTITNIE